MRQDIDQIAQRQHPELEPVAWSGYRKFVVDRIEREANSIASIYLIPEDGRSLPAFKPGQHLTFRFQVPGHSKPVVRCYSLSDSPHRNHYRITVKKCLPPVEQPNVRPGLVSSFVNEGLRRNEVVDVKAPSGSFFLETQSTRPAVLLGGGIGITPMLSMINSLVDQGSKRLILLVYAVRNSTEHAFREQFVELEKAHKNLQVVTCYSQPLPQDELGKHFNFAGHADGHLLRQLLPNGDMDFYMCGPPPFMANLYDDLIHWGVDDSNIHFESFGPASIKRIHERASGSNEDASRLPSSHQIAFSSHDSVFEWTGEFDNLLAFAEANGIPMESGCRSGNCGTCEVGISAGQVTHSEDVTVEPGRCLACIATPNSDLKIEA